MKVFGLQVVVLRNIGGRHLDEFTRRVLPFIMENKLAMQVNLLGRNGKRAFCDTNLLKIFMVYFVLGVIADLYR